MASTDEYEECQAETIEKVILQIEELLPNIDGEPLNLMYPCREVDGKVYQYRNEVIISGFTDSDIKLVAPYLDDSDGLNETEIYNLLKKQL